MNDDHVYIIGEIGQNHNGSLDIAELIIDLAARPVHEDAFNLDLAPLNAVKMVKRDLNEELAQDQMNKVYDSPNSFGKTYGEHRKYLELDDTAHFEAYKYAKAKGLDFVETICAIGAMSILKLFTPDYLKVASRDLTNLPLLHCLASTKIPIILSTGMAEQRDLDDALEVITRYHDNISILHCTSEYPTHPIDVNLRAIEFLKKHYGKYVIGFSDHTIGISAPIAAIAMGARIIEKHITIDRRMKGTDQAGSLGPDGLNRMIRDIRLLEMSLGKEAIFVKEGVESARIKLERSIATKRVMRKGEVITINDIHLLSPGDGYRWRDLDKVIGKVLNRDIDSNSIIYEDYIE